MLNSMHEGNRFSSKTLGKSLLHFQNERCSHGPAGQFWLLESALSSKELTHETLTILSLLLHLGIKSWLGHSPKSYYTASLQTLHSLTGSWTQKSAVSFWQIWAYSTHGPPLLTFVLLGTCLNNVITASPKQCSTVAQLMSGNARDSQSAESGKTSPKGLRKFKWDVKKRP